MGRYRKHILILFIINKLIGNHVFHEKIQEAPSYLPCKIEAFVNISQERIHRFSLLYRLFGNSEFLERQMFPSLSVAFEVACFCIKN